MRVTACTGLGFWGPGIFVKCSDSFSASQQQSRSSAHPKGLALDRKHKGPGFGVLGLTIRLLRFGVLRTEPADGVSFRRHQTLTQTAPIPTEGIRNCLKFPCDAGTRKADLGQLAFFGVLLRLIGLRV